MKANEITCKTQILKTTFRHGGPNRELDGASAGVNPYAGAVSGRRKPYGSCFAREAAGGWQGGGEAVPKSGTGNF